MIKLWLKTCTLNVENMIFYFFLDLIINVDNVHLINKTI